MSQLNSESVARYFSGADGAGSNFMGMCAAVLADSHESVDCRACSGKGYRALTEAELRGFAKQLAKQKTTEHRDQVRQALSRASDCEDCKGSGKVSRRRRGDHTAAMDSMFTTVACGRCHGCGEAAPPTDASAERQDVCLGCGGDAYIVPVTVRPTGSTNEGGSGGSSATDFDAGPLLLAAPDAAQDQDSRLSERRGVASELRAIRAQDPQLAAALESYHGPEGARWVEHRWGRAFTLWQHTPAGKQLAEHVAEQSVRGCGHLVAPTERLARARETQERPPEGRTRADHQLQRVLLARADREARDLLRRVLAAVSDVETAA